MEGHEDAGFEPGGGMDPALLELIATGPESTRGLVLPERPIWVVGAPRSGSTWFGRVLDSHPSLFLTEETRVMTFANRVFNRLTRDRWILMNGRQAWISRLAADLPGTIERFYADLGALPSQRWGDKHPHYADGETDPECLEFIYALFPDSQFIHLVRDGRDVATSIRDKGWGDATSGAQVWVRHVAHARHFADSLAPDSWLEVRYEDLIRAPEAGFRSVFDFLDLEVVEQTERYITDSRTESWSGPSTPRDRLGTSTWRERLSQAEIDEVERIAQADLIAHGYM